MGHFHGLHAGAVKHLIVIELLVCFIGQRDRRS